MQVGALRKVVVFRTLAQEQLENLADALEAGRDEKCRARMGHRDPGGQALEYSQHLRAWRNGVKK